MIASRLVSLRFTLCLGAVGGALAACSEPGDSTASDEAAAVSSGDLDDAVAKVLLAGGCTVKAGNATLKTAGAGGACPTTLTGVLDALDKSDGKFRSFVVKEDHDQKNAPGHRFVLAAGGKNEGKLFVSPIGEAEQAVEMMGFSEKAQAFVFYKEEGGVWVRKGDGSQVKSQAKGAKPAFECVNCHTTGGPQMKELHDPWPNWFSTWSGAFNGLDAGSALFKRMFDSKAKADLLEPSIVQAQRLHSKGRVDRAKKDGSLKGVLTQLMCEVGEPSLISGHFRNGARFNKVSSSSTMLPTSILLNSLWNAPLVLGPDVAGVPGFTGRQLGLTEALGVNLPSLDTVVQSLSADAYVKAIEKNGQTIGGKPGDAIFAMLSPEKGYADIDVVQELLRQKLVDKELVADVMMTDFTVPAFSNARCALAGTLPDTWADASELRTKWGPSLASSKLRGAKGLAARLSDTKDLAEHPKRLETFLAACLKRSQETTFTADMVRIVSQRRVEFGAEFKPIIESSFLLPQDKLGSTPGAIRLNGSTCAIENQTENFVGED